MKETYAKVPYSLYASEAWRSLQVTRQVTQITLLTINALGDSATQSSTHINNIIISNDIINNNHNNGAGNFVVPPVMEIQDYLNQINEHRFTAVEFYDYYDVARSGIVKHVWSKSPTRYRRYAPNVMTLKATRPDVLGVDSSERVFVGGWQCIYHPTDGRVISISSSILPSKLFYSNCLDE